MTISFWECVECKGVVETDQEFKDMKDCPCSFCGSRLCHKRSIDNFMQEKEEMQSVIGIKKKKRRR